MTFAGRSSGPGLKYLVERAAAGKPLVVNLLPGVYTGSCGIVVSALQFLAIRASSPGVIIDCEHQNRFIKSFVEIELTGIDIRNGGSMISNDLDGGCISVVGAHLTLINTTISECSSEGRGGGISVSGCASQLTISGNSTVKRKYFCTWLLCMHTNQHFHISLLC